MDKILQDKLEQVKKMYDRNRLIADLYMRGYSLRKIPYILEDRGYLGKNNQILSYETIRQTLQKMGIYKTREELTLRGSK